jgi:hypothetical protein
MHNQPWMTYEHPNGIKKQKFDDCHNASLWIEDEKPVVVQWYADEAKGWCKFQQMMEK